MLKGFADRLEREVRAGLVVRNMAGAASGVRVTARPSRKRAVWLGGSILAASDGEQVPREEGGEGGGRGKKGREKRREPTGAALSRDRGRDVGPEAWLGDAGSFRSDDLPCPCPDSLPRWCRLPFPLLESLAFPPHPRTHHIHDCHTPVTAAFGDMVITRQAYEESGPALFHGATLAVAL